MKNYMLMNEAGDGADLGASAPVATPSTTPSTTGSALGAEPAGDDWLPEKFRVKGDGDALDVTASARKLAEAYKHAETRLGTGDAPPKTADEYDVKSELFDFAEFKANENNTAFLKAAHAKGMTNDQVQFVLDQYHNTLPELVTGAVQLDTEAAMTTFKDMWGADVGAQLGYARAAAVAAGLTDEQINSPQIGNNPDLVKVLAFFGAQMGEGQTIAGGVPSADDLESLMKSDAYMNPSHPDHTRTYNKVQQFYARR